MDVRPTHMRFCGGRSTPAIRAMHAPQFFRKLSLALLVLRVVANNAHYTAPVDDLALVANFLYRCSDFHFDAPCPALLFRGPTCTCKRFGHASNRMGKVLPPLCPR